MNVFNSLGSNYTPELARAALFMRADGSDREKLRTYLEKRYGGSVLLFYKGREALSAALEASGLPQQSEIAITGYTCYAVYQAVTAAGMIPVFVDIGDNDVNFTTAGLESLLRRRAGIRAVIIQHTYGFPQDMQGIGKTAARHKLIVIEDLAHAVGATVAGGQPAGTAGDFTVLSFSQDKMIDAVSGGALISRTGKGNPRWHVGKTEIPASDISRDRRYPILTSVIRSTYPFPGKLIHAATRTLGLLTQPMGDTQRLSYRELPAWHAKLTMQAFQYLRDDCVHRRNISRIYTENIRPEYLIPETGRKLHLSAPVRFPVSVPDRSGLIAMAKHRGIHIADIWYDAPVAPKKYFLRTTYAGECPNAEALSESVVNLPTHRNVSETQARTISQLVNSWRA